jgi:hypothetical protein
VEYAQRGIAKVKKQSLNQVNCEFFREYPDAITTSYTGWAMLEAS